MKTITQINQDLRDQGKSPFKQWAIFAFVWVVIGSALMQYDDFKESNKPVPVDTVQVAADKEAKDIAKAKKIADDLASDSRLYAISFMQDAIKSGLRDPSSVEWDFKAANLDNGALCFNYRARNGFNGMARGVGVMTSKGKYIATASAFNKYCPNDANYERY